MRESSGDTLETFRVGGQATLRATSLSRGEFEPLWAGVRPRDEGTPPFVVDARVRGGWSASNRVALVAEVYGQTSRRNDPTVRQRALRNTSGIVDMGETYVNTALGRLDLSFGRSWAAWLGDDRESMALSANGPLIDRLELGIRWRVAEVRAIVASVNDVTMTAETDSLAAGTPDTRFNRWLYGHVLTVKPNDGLELTLGETICCRHARPLGSTSHTRIRSWRTSSRRTTRRARGRTRATISWCSVGHECALGAGTSARSSSSTTSRSIKPIVKTRPISSPGASYGSIPVPLGNASSVTADFTRVDSYTYMRDFYTDVYQQYDKPLGSVLGPGSDRLRLAGETWIGGGIRIGGSVGTWRQGGLRIDQRPARGPNGNAGKPFPAVTPDRPEVQSSFLADIGADYVTHPILGSIRLQLAQIRNAANVSDAAALYVRAIVSGSYAFRYP